MSSMYETIMELPLFKGIGEEQLSQMLEKTSVEFIKYEEGELISAPGEAVKAVDFIISGRVRQSYPMENYSLTIDEILGKGAMLGALNLFGMETKTPGEVRALSKVSIMRVPKVQYMNILQTDPIYILNFVNYLSAAAQKTPAFVKEMKTPSISRSLESLAFAMVSRNADTVMVAGEDEEMARFCGVSTGEFAEWRSNELMHNRIHCNSRGIFLRSPHLSR